VAAIELTARWVAAAAGGAIVSGDPDRRFAGVSIDTRTLKRDALYVAIRGERFDGADFADKARAAGAAGVIVPRGRGASLSGVVIEVADTTAALQGLARAVRREAGTRVVAITGSAGKTTTKEVTAELLAGRYRVMRNRGNFNNHIGLPLSLMELTERPDVAVVELGMNHAGEIRTLVSIAEPDVRVWTNVGDAHLGFFSSVDAIADAKGEILEDAGPSTLLVANADDDRVRSRSAAFRGRVVTFGIERDADVKALDTRDRGVDGMSARVATRAGAVDISTPLVGRANLANLLAGIGVAVELDVPLDQIRDRAARLHPAAHRGEIVRLAGPITVIDDSYNANPTAVARALDVLHATPAERRVAVLGEMLELGPHSTALHERVGRAAARAGVDVLVAVGGAPAAALAAAAVAEGMAASAVEHRATSDDAAALVSATVRPGDLVLVKGSRGIATDRVVERLKAERS
jgi:UDP-N-acetylmuramoyl-tripeptide--D-alanyl-D-alanine ligase